MTYEKTQKGNPHGLTLRQHVFPKFLIKNFCDGSGHVSLFEKSTAKENKKTPKDYIFCTKRTWNQRAESGFMKKIEDDFLFLSKNILERKIDTIDISSQNIATEMFCLWKLRHTYKKAPVSDMSVKNAEAFAHEYTKDEREHLEKEGVISVQNGSVSGRDIAGTRIQLQLFHLKSSLFKGKGKWVILTSKTANFLVPDAFDKAILPIHPNTCLYFAIGAKEVDKEIDHDDVKVINEWAIDASTDYYFAKDLTLCPKK